MLKNLFPSYVFNSDARNLSNFANIQTEIQQYLKTKEAKYLPWFGKTHKLYEKSFNINDANLLGYCPLLKAFIEDQIAKFLIEIKPIELVEKTIDQLKIGSSWATKFDNGDFAHQHHHLPDEISGVYYYQVPETAPLDAEETNRYEGHLYFVTPVMGHYMSPMTAPLQRVFVTPQEGKLILFPSYLEHGVMPCDNKDEPRISISFNGSIHHNAMLKEIKQRDTK